jgi:hypothetical protein
MENVGIFYGHSEYLSYLVHVMSLSAYFGIFFPFGHVLPRKSLNPVTRHRMNMLRLKVFFNKGYHPIPRRDWISRPIAPQAETRPLDHATGAPRLKVSPQLPFKKTVDELASKHRLHI